MFDIKVYNLPTKEDNVFIIERKYCELYSRYRNGEVLDEVEINWMDNANTWLMELK